MLDSMVPSPPMPEPMATPMRPAFSSVTSIPASRMACMPAPIP